MRMRLMVMAAAIGVLIVSACATGPKSPTVSGLWAGRFNLIDNCAVFTLDLAQSDTNITGHWTQASCGSGGILAEGSNLQGTDVSGNVEIMFGGVTFVGTLSANGDTLSGTLASVTFFMTRQ
jgi:hypothetical protein